ncbi:UvrD-helicase domain-containing protein [Patescibacteria group bacterium]|nr:UvrD-helicase domain-containing protein [Patescibacteria group bacterium]MBU1703059.1 UvrD-helicase domain-containing protein [Patescibacteria group bacterium]MBU1954152.1 UvrD-helicase domain-containing protein [Patescibacteria group bacterium]
MSEILENLNPEQKEAVSQTEGPMLIVAGAGTGKTRVITARILHLLIDKKVPSSQILALTFTEKATNEMLERVDQGMPLSYEEVTIKTFHGFCDMILREKGMEIGIDPGFRLLNQADQWLLIKRNLFALDLNHYRPLGNPGKFIHVLLSHFSRLKDEDIKPDDYIRFAGQMLDKAGDDAEKENAGKMLEVANAYAAYQNLLIESNGLDFGDLQFYALRLLEKRPSVLRELRERYKYILVDEFQDTNFAQNKLVMLLAREHTNITVVGDDDQSIYKWRGASLSNILTFEKEFPQAKRVVLTQNYRSNQGILDSAYQSIQNNNPDRLEHRASISKRLVSRVLSEGADENPVEVRHFSDSQDEVKCVLDTISGLAKDGVAYSEMAILVRTNAHATAFVDALKDAGIPFTVRDTQGLLRFEEIKDLVALLRFLVRPQDDIAFFRLLGLPIFGIPMATVLQIVNEARNAHFTPIFYYLRDRIVNGTQSSLPGLEETSGLESVIRLCDNLLNFSRDHGAFRVIGEFLDESGYVKALTANDSFENEEKIQHIAQFLELARDLEADGGDNSLRVFLDYIDSLQEALGTIAAATTPENDAVSMLTVHSAKGLEFDYVFVPCLVKERFPSRPKRDPIEIPAALLPEDIPEKEMHLQEERRLFYVAATRARKRLFLSYSDSYEGNKKWKISPFLAELDDLACVRWTDSLRDAVSGDLEKDDAIKDERAFDRCSMMPDVKIYQLSYSKLDTFNTCPLKYKFRYHYKIPSPSAHAANFGSSVHNTVNKFYEEVMAGAPPNSGRLKELFESNWIGIGYESRGHELARKKHGIEVMEKFFEKEKQHGFKAPAMLEKPFRLRIGDVIFMGRIDRIDKLPDGTYEVIDYKTGKAKSANDVKKDLQLSLYALACSDIFKIPVSALSLYFLEDAVKVSTTRPEENFDAIREDILQKVKSLRESDLAPTPGFHCGFCEFGILCHRAI